MVEPYFDKFLETDKAVLAKDNWEQESYFGRDKGTWAFH